MQTPTSPADNSIPFDSPRAITGGWNASGNSPVDGAQNPDGRLGRRYESNNSSPRDPSTPRDAAGYWDRSTPRDRTRPNGRPVTKSPGGSSRICKKCGEPLTGQFVRALLSTYHLECFKCEVSFHRYFYMHSVSVTDLSRRRIVAKSWLPSSFLLMRKMGVGNTLYVKQTTFGDWTSSVMNAVAPCEAHI